MYPGAAKVQRILSAWSGGAAFSCQALPLAYFFILDTSGVFSEGVFFVKSNAIWFLKGGREDWCDPAGLTANMWRIWARKELKLWIVGFFVWVSVCLFVLRSIWTWKSHYRWQFCRFQQLPKWDLSTGFVETHERWKTRHRFQKAP